MPLRASVVGLAMSRSAARPDGAVTRSIARPTDAPPPRARAGGGLPEAVPRIPLTPREQQTLDLVLAGLSTKAIADRLEISTNTAAQHIKVILRRYGVGSRVALLVLLLGDDRERPSPVALAPREREALELLLVGLSARQIAARLGVGVHAANQLTKAIFRRHGVGSRAELLARLLYRSIQPHAFGADDPETPHARLPPADHAPPARSSEVRAPRSVRGGGEGDAPPPGRARRRGRRARGPEKVVSRR